MDFLFIFMFLDQPNLNNWHLYNILKNTPKIVKSIQHIKQFGKDNLGFIIYENKKVNKIYKYSPCIQ